jgi:site-specific DNA-methyltransferase (adenine-specific)
MDEGDHERMSPRPPSGRARARLEYPEAPAFEDARFEIRDVILHLWGQGFPKSTNAAIMIDKHLGAMGHRGRAHHAYGPGKDFQDRDLSDPLSMPAHEGITEEAKRFQGYGSALKPSYEGWILARKPLEGTIAKNCIEHGTGALNIDGCRVAHGTDVDLSAKQRQQNAGGAVNFGAAGLIGSEIPMYNPGGRWPPHLLLTHAADCGETCADGCPVAEMDAQSGVSASGVASPKSNGWRSTYVNGEKQGEGFAGSYGDTGGASRFFPVFRYVAKPSTAEKSAGLDGRNLHPTAKPIALMRWMIRLICPPRRPDGSAPVVLDPFAGSGTTGVAAVSEGADFLGIEMDPQFAAYARDRICHAVAGLEVEVEGDVPERSSVEASGQGRLF